MNPDDTCRHQQMHTVHSRLLWKCHKAIYADHICLHKIDTYKQSGNKNQKTPEISRQMQQILRELWLTSRMLFDRRKPWLCSTDHAISVSLTFIWQPYVSMKTAKCSNTHTCAHSHYYDDVNDTYDTTHNALQSLTKSDYFVRQTTPFHSSKYNHV